MKEANEQGTAVPVVFISYARDDRPTADAIDQFLRDQGAQVLIDHREFIFGNDIDAEVARCIEIADKVVHIYSGKSAVRPYPVSERRIVAMLEKGDATLRVNAPRRLIYLCIDETPLPTEDLPRLAIMAAHRSFDDVCKDLWRAILGKSAPPKRLDLSVFRECPPWSMDESRKNEVARTAWVVIDSVLAGQQTGTTLGKWMMDTYREITEGIDRLPDERKVTRVLSRLRAIVQKNDAWERRNPIEDQMASERDLIERQTQGANGSTAITKLAAPEMYHGVMEDNRRLHRINRELLEDVEALVGQGTQVPQIVDYVKNVLCKQS